MYSWDNAQVVLVGNKCDLEQDRAVTQERGQRLADQLGKFSYLNVLMYNMDVRLSYLFVVLAICVLSLLFFRLCMMLYLFSRVLQIKTHCWEKAPVMLIGNKCDMDDDRDVQTDEGARLASELGIFVWERAGRRKNVPFLVLFNLISAFN